MKGEVGRELSIQYLLSCPPVTILCLCVSFLSLFLLPNISIPHAPTLELLGTCPGWIAAKLTAKDDLQQLDL